MTTGYTGVTGPVFNETVTGTTGWHEQHGPSSEEGQHFPNNQPGVGTQYDRPTGPTGQTGHSGGHSGWSGTTGRTGHTGFFKRVEEDIVRDYDNLRAKL